MTTEDDAPTAQAFGIIIMLAGIIAGVVVAFAMDDPSKLVTTAIVGGPLLIAGAVIYAAEAIVAAIRRS